MMKYFLSVLMSSSLFLSGCNEQPVSSSEQIKLKPDYNEIVIYGSRIDGITSYHRNSYHVVLDAKGNPKAITKDFSLDPIVAPGYEKEYPNARKMSKEQYEELKKITKANKDLIYKLEVSDSKRNR